MLCLFCSDVMCFQYGELYAFLLDLFEWFSPNLLSVYPFFAVKYPSI